MLGKVYNIFGFEPHHKLYLGISTLLKECIFKFLDSHRLETNPSAVLEQWQPLSRMKVSILRGVNFLPVAIDRKTGVPGLHVDCSSKGYSMHWNALFLNNGVSGMLKRENYRAVKTVFLPIQAYVDDAARFQNDANITCVLRSYSDTVSKVVSQNYGQAWIVAEL